MKSPETKPKTRCCNPRLAALQKATQPPQDAAQGDAYVEIAKMANFTHEGTLTVQDVSYLLKCSTDMVRLWLRKGKLRGWQIGGRFSRVLVSEQSVRELLMTGTRRFGKRDTLENVRRD